MKKLLTLTLAIIMMTMMVFSVVACGNNEEVKTAIDLGFESSGNDTSSQQKDDEKEEEKEQDSEPEPKTIAIAYAGGYVLGLRDDGTVLKAGDRRISVDDWNNIISIHAFDYAAFGIKDDGRVVVASIGEPPAIDSWTDIVDIVADDRYAVGLKSNGTLVHTADFDVSGLTDIVAISGKNSREFLALKSNGTVLRVVGNDRSMDSFIEGWNDIKEVAYSGGNYAVGLKENGTVIEADLNGFVSDVGYFSIVNGWTDIVRIAHRIYGPSGLKSNGTVVTIEEKQGDGKMVFEEKIIWTDIVDISAGYGNLIGLKTDGTVVVDISAGHELSQNVIDEIISVFN